MLPPFNIEECFILVYLWILSIAEFHIVELKNICGTNDWIYKIKRETHHSQFKTEDDFFVTTVTEEEKHVETLIIKTE